MRIFNAAVVLAAGVLALWHWVPAAWAQSECAAQGGTVDQGGVCRIHTTTDAYKIDASYPTDYADQQALSNYLSQTRDGFINVSQMPGNRNLPYQLEIDSDEFHSAKPPQHATQSVVLKVFQDVGGSHPQTWYRSFNYDLDAHRPITFDTLFVPGAKPLDVIFPIVRGQLERDVAPSGVISPADGLDPTHYQNFALTDDDLIFYFGQGELLPATAGANVVHVPRAAVVQMLA
jgi:Protein of unknown function (DUF3298)